VCDGVTPRVVAAAKVTAAHRTSSASRLVCNARVRQRIPHGHTAPCALWAWSRWCRPRRDHSTSQWAPDEFVGVCVVLWGGGVGVGVRVGQTHTPTSEAGIRPQCKNTPGPSIHTHTGARTHTHTHSEHATTRHHTPPRHARPPCRRTGRPSRAAPIARAAPRAAGCAPPRPHATARRSASLQACCVTCDV
jgi:hypothetical protein